MLKNILRSIATQTRDRLAESRDWLTRTLEDRNFDKDPTLLRWLNFEYRKLISQPGAAQRPNYAWGVLQGVNLAKALDIARVSVIEFGVAGGNGLVSLETTATLCESIFGVIVDVYGFDAGTGLPEPRDYRDSPNLWRAGAFPMDVEQLRQRLKRAQLVLGQVCNSIESFVQSGMSPVAFIAFDLNLYSSTVQALALLDAPSSMLLPRVHCYFDDTLGFMHSEFTGERLAISEFNNTHKMQKISQILGLKYYVPRKVANAQWIDSFYMAHIFDHELYNKSDGIIRSTRMDLMTESGW